MKTNKTGRPLLSDYLFSLLCLFGMLFSLVACDAQGEKSSSEMEDDDDTVSSRIINPFLLSYRRWDYHLAQWTDDHPTYEMAELMVVDVETDAPKVWVFFTEAAPPKKQWHYVNDDTLVAYLTDGGADNTVNLVPMTFSLNDGPDGTLVFEVAFEDENGVPISWRFETVEAPSTTYGDMLIEQSGHDLKGGILVMYVYETALSSKNTLLTIGDAEYAPPFWEEISAPPYFEAVHAICTRDLSLGYLAAGDAAYTLVSAPEVVEPGAVWQLTYTNDAGDPEPFEWTVTDASSDTVTLGSGEWRMVVVPSGTGYDIAEAGAETEDGYMTLRFTPALDDITGMADGKTHEAAFAIDIDGHRDQITGQATLTREGDTATLLLAPEQPDWAVTNQLRSTITLQGKSQEVSCETVQIE